MNEFKWYGFNVACKCSEDRDKISTIFTKVMGKDVKRIQVVVDDDIAHDNTIMVFVECRNLSDHISKLRCNRSIPSMITSWESPTEIPAKQVEAFFDSINEKKCTFKPGDFVKPKEGYLANLYGMVTSVRKYSISVLFRFHMKSMVKKFKPSQLQFCYHIADKFSNSGKLSHLIEAAKGRMAAFDKNAPRKKKKKRKK